MKFKKNIITEMLNAEKSISLGNDTSTGLDNNTGSLKIIAKVKALPVALLSVAFLLSAVGTYVSYSNKLDKSRQEISYLSDLSKNSEKIAKNTFLITQGDPEGFAELKNVKEKVNKLLNVIKLGGKINDDDTEIDPIPLSFESEMNTVTTHWTDNRRTYDSILKNANGLVGLKSDITRLAIEIKNLDSALDLLISKETDPTIKAGFVQAKEAIVRVNESMPLLFESNNYNPSIGSQFVKDLQLINGVLNDSVKGNRRSVNSDVITIINNLSKQSLLLEKTVNDMKAQVSALADIQVSAKSLRSSAKMISTTSEKLNSAFIEDASTLKYQSALSLVLFLLSALGFGLLTLIFYEKSEIASKGKKIAERNQANENSINLLIKKMNPLDEGDFTQRVYVDDKFVGRIAEKVDNTREIFGNIVKKIKNTSILVKSSANETDGTSKNLLELSSAQYRKMGNSIVKLGRVSSEMDEVAQTAWIAKEDALKSKAASEEGSKLVEESIKKMDQIRDTIQESSKKIKKSSESAQAITEVTGIIQNITKQIEILALNAAIQAASSGESGREFTVVAQAVQELALDSKEATNRILELVGDVQKDIGGAVDSMEKTTQEVVTGARLTDEAGKALKEIKVLSEDVAVKIEETSQKIEAKSLDMTNISLEMKELQIETEKTADIVKLTSEQVDRLKTISEELENSVHGFKVED